jgi:hypothetical protein
MWLRSRVLPGERKSVVALALLLFMNTLVLESNEVIATSGFISNVGVSYILLLWAIMMLMTMLTSCTYLVFIDRVDRKRFGMILFGSASLFYVAFYFLFTFGVSDFASYGLLSIFTEQQWALFPLVIWALASDIFPVAAAKRLFPILSTAVILGGVVGNGVAATIGQWLDAGGYVLLLFNTALMLASAAVLGLTVPRVNTQNGHFHTNDRIVAVIKEGLEFVRNVPAYRSLAITMILMGICLNTIQYQFLVDVATHYSAPGQLQLFYGIYRIASVPMLLLLQGGVATWLLKHIGFKAVFSVMPGSTFLSLLLIIFWFNPLGGALMITGAMVGDYLVRLALNGIDQPARRAFQGLVPDQRRGRVSALMEGFLYQTGSVLSCFFISGVLLAVNRGWLTAPAGRAIYIGVAFVCVLAAFGAVRNLYVQYDESMLNWRLKHRQKGRSVLDRLEF